MVCLPWTRSQVPSHNSTPVRGMILQQRSRVGLIPVRALLRTLSEYPAKIQRPASHPSRRTARSLSSYPEGAIPCLKHSNVCQNITYNSGVDTFMLMRLQGANGDTIQFGDKTVRMLTQLGEYPVVLEVSADQGTCYQ